MNDDDGWAPNTPDPDNLSLPAPGQQRQDVRSLVTAHNRPDRYLSPSEPPCYLQAAVEGASVRLSIARQHERKGGGLRGEITGFSRQSRNRLLRTLGAINRSSYGPRQVLFLTLTYHHHWPEDAGEQYAQLRAWHKRLKRRFGDLPLFWRKEWQDRGAPHFHCIVFTPPELVPQDGQDWEFLTAATECWVELVRRPGDSKMHMWRYSVDAKFSESWKGAMSYASKHMRYISKKEAIQPRDPDGNPLPTGRLWGYLDKRQLPISWETTRITFKEYLQTRRLFRRISRPKHRRWLRRRIPSHELRDAHVLLSYSELRRYLTWLGYYAE